MTRALFLRVHWDDAASKLCDLALTVPAEPEYLTAASKLTGEFLSVRRVAIQRDAGNRIERANAIVDPDRWNLPRWTQAAAPVRFARGDVQLLLLGPGLAENGISAKTLRCLSVWRRLFASRSNE